MEGDGMSARDDHAQRVLAGVAEPQCWAALFDEIDRVRHALSADTATEMVARLSKAADWYDPADEYLLNAACVIAASLPATQTDDSDPTPPHGIPRPSASFPAALARYLTGTMTVDVTPLPDGGAVITVVPVGYTRPRTRVAISGAGVSAYELRDDPPGGEAA